MPDDEKQPKTPNADWFGGAVTAAMGKPVEFAEWPSLRPSLHLAATWAWDDFLYGDYGPREKLTGAMFADRAREMADDLISRNDNLSDFPWAAGPTKPAFLAAVEKTFDQWRGTAPAPAPTDAQAA
jgi:hypothetical protein